MPEQETNFRKSICDDLKNCGCEIIPYVMSKENRNGIPDTIIVSTYGIWFLEFKAWNGTVRRVQDATIKALNLTRIATAFVVKQKEKSNYQIGWLVINEGQQIGYQFRGGRELLKLLQTEEGFFRVNKQLK